MCYCMFLSCHVRLSEWMHTLYLPECQEFLARNRREIWSLSDCNGTQIYNHLVRKRTFNHLARFDQNYLRFFKNFKKQCALQGLKEYIVCLFVCVIADSEYTNNNKHIFLFLELFFSGLCGFCSLLNHSA